MKKKPVHRASRLEDVLNTLQEIECMSVELQSTDDLETLTTGQKTEYRYVLKRLRSLIHDLEQDSIQEQLAS